MDSRNILTILIVIFVAVLLYNALYFTGVIGGFGQETALEPLPQEDRFAIPGMERGDQPRQPRPSQPATRRAVSQPDNGRRATIAPDRLSLGSSWGRGPFLTPREIWAIDNFQPVYQTVPEAAPTDLYVSAVMLDSSGRRVAIIDGEVYSVGDTVGGMPIVDMWNDGVVLQGARGQHVIRIGDPVIDLRTSTGGRQ